MKLVLPFQTSFPFRFTLPLRVEKVSWVVTEFIERAEEIKHVIEIPRDFYRSIKIDRKICTFFISFMTQKAWESDFELYSELDNRFYT